MIMKENEYSQKAGKLFCEGYNCAQSVFCAFSDDLGINLELGTNNFKETISEAEWEG